jgi:hypothetical protein
MLPITARLRLGRFYLRDTMLDVHIIVSDQSRKDWVDQCLESVCEAMVNASFDVDLHIVSGTKGHIGKGRSEGYSLGTQPYATCVDDDDYVLPYAFENMARHFDGKPSAICTPEFHLQNEKFTQGSRRHHLIAYRRDVLIDHSRWVCCGDVAQIGCMGSDVIDLPAPGYVHRLYLESSARVLRRDHQDELRKARGQLLA